MYKRVLRESLVDSSWHWNRVSAVGGEVSLFDRRVGSWREAVDFVGISRQSIVRRLGRGLKRIRFSDLEQLRIEQGCEVEYRQVCSLEEMEELVESNRALGRVTFAYIAADGEPDELLVRAWWAALRAGRELLFDEWPNIGEAPGELEEPCKYIGARRVPWGREIRVLQQQMIARKWAKKVVIVSRWDNLEELLSEGAVVFGSHSLLAPVRAALDLDVKIFVNCLQFYTINKIFSGSFLPLTWTFKVSKSTLQMRAI